jgi:hypothetical protein
VRGEDREKGSSLTFVRKKKKMGRLRKKEQKVEERKKNVQKEGSVSVRVCGPCGGVGWWT